MKPESFKCVDCCEHCKFISWITRKDAWCTKHDFDLNPYNEKAITKICDDYFEE